MNVVTIFFRNKEGVQTHIQLPWRDGRKLKQYLHDAPARRYHLIGYFLSAKALGSRRRKLKLTSTLERGETVYLVRVRTMK